MAGGNHKSLRECLILGSAKGTKSIVFKLRKGSGVRIKGRMYYYLMVTHKGTLKERKLARIRAILKETNDANIANLVVDGWKATEQLAQQSEGQEQQARRKYLLRGDEVESRVKYQDQCRYWDMFYDTVHGKAYDARKPGEFLGSPGIRVKSNDLDAWLEAAEKAVAGTPAKPKPDPRLELSKLAAFRTKAKECLEGFRAEIDKEKRGDRSRVAYGLHYVFESVCESLRAEYPGDPAVADLWEYLFGMRPTRIIEMDGNPFKWLSDEWEKALRGAKGNEGTKWSGTALKVEFVNVVRNDIEPYV